MPHKFFIISKEGDSGGLAFRLKEEGHAVRMYVEAKWQKEGLNGLIDKVESVEAGLKENPDVIVFDHTGFGALADKLTKEGLNVIGGGEFNDRLEADRSFSMELVESCGVLCPPYREFDRGQIDEAISFVTKEKKRFVIKPDDNAGGTAATYVGDSPEDMIRHLRWCKEENVLDGEFMLQEFVKGIELSTEIWFSKGVPIHPANGTMELKKFLNDDLGPNTGCSFSVVWPYERKEPKIVGQTLKKLYPVLKEVKYTGPIDMNCIVDERGRAQFLEFTPRFGYSALYALAELMGDSVGETLFKVASGTKDNLPVRKEFGLALRMTIAPYPLDSNDEHHKIFLETENRMISKLPPDHTWPLDLKLDKKGRLVTAGGDGCICEITTSEKNLKKAADQLYEMAKKVEIPDVQYRTDGITRALEELTKLRRMGYDVPALL